MRASILSHDLRAHSREFAGARCAPDGYIAIVAGEHQDLGHERTLTAPAGHARAAPRGGDDFAVGACVAGRYAIVRFIAAGGMGEVYEAEDLLLGTRVALKAVSAAATRSDDAIHRLVREIALARKVTHPNVCRVHDAGQHGPRAFLTMELLEGETLAERLRRGPLSEAEIERIAAELSDALDALHAERVVHRDFKSSNVILALDGDDRRAVVTDFGLARGGATSDDAELTGCATLVGTPAYMAPEQVEGLPATTASDIYSFGVVLFEMWTGTLPFAESTPLATAMARLTRPAPRARDRRADVPARWDAAIARCLERDPARRPGSARELLDLLGRRRRRALRRALAGAFAVAIGAAIALRPGDRERPAPAAMVAPPPAAACPGAARKLVGVWDPATRARIAMRFESSPHEFVHDAWRGHARQLDLATAAWSMLWDQACRASDRDDDPLLYGQRLACLETSLSELRAVSGELGNPVIAVDEFAIASPGSFPIMPPRTCSDERFLRAQGPPPPVAARPAIAALMVEFRRLRFRVRLATTGPDADIDSVLAQFTSLERQVAALGYPSGQAEIAFWHGVFLFWFRRYAEADALATSIADLAERTRDDVHLVMALALAVDVRSRQGPPYDAAGAEAALARAARAATRLGDSPYVVEWIEEARTEHLVRMRRYQESLATRARQAELRRQLELPSLELWARGGIDWLRAWNGEAGEVVADTRMVLRAREELSGSRSVLLADDLALFSRVFALAGDPATALAHAERAIAIYQAAWRGRPEASFWPAHVSAAGFAARTGATESVDRHLRAAVAAAVAHGDSHLAGFARVARMLRQRGDRAAAERALALAAAVPGTLTERARIDDERAELAADAGLPAPRLHDARRRAIQRARTFLERGRAAAAVTVLRKLAGRFDAATSWDDPERGDVEAWLGMALLAVGQRAAAIEHLDQALWIHGRCCWDGAAVDQEARLALAGALWSAGDRATARRLATAARAGWTAMGPAFEPKAGAADAWLAAHPGDRPAP